MSRHSSRGSEWNKTRQRILQRDNYICAYCQAEATTVDHVIAKALGGKDTDDNLVAACRVCNGRKQDKAYVRQRWYSRKYFESI